MSSIIQNKLNGKMAESYAISDLRKNGFTVIRFTKCDFIALSRIINWFIEVDGGDLGSDMYLVYENEDVMASPNRPLGILLSIGVIAWFV